MTGKELLILLANMEDLSKQIYVDNEEENKPLNLKETNYSNEYCWGIVIGKMGSE